MAIKDKRKRYKKGERVDMRQGGRVQLAKGSSAATKRKKKAAQAKKAESIQQPSRSAIRGRPTEEQFISPPSIQEAPRPIGGKGAGKGQVTESFDPNVGRPPKPTKTLMPIPKGKPLGTLNPNLNELDPAEVRRMQERMRMAQQGQPIPGELGTLQGQSISPQQQLLNEAREARGRPKEQQPTGPSGDQPVRRFPTAATPEQVAEERRRGGSPLFQTMQAQQQAAPAGTTTASTTQTEAQMLGGMQQQLGDEFPVVTEENGGEGGGGVDTEGEEPVSAEETAESEGEFPVDAEIDDTYTDENGIKWVYTTEGWKEQDAETPIGTTKIVDGITYEWDGTDWVVKEGEPKIGDTKVEDGITYEYTADGWVALSDDDTALGTTKVENGITYVYTVNGWEVQTDTTTTTTTQTQAQGATKITDPKSYAQWLAGGLGPTGETVIPPAEQVEAGVYTPQEVNTSWQEGGLQGTLLTNEQGLTGQNIYEALDPANPADSVEIDGVTYTWDDFHNLIKQEATDFIGAEKPGSAVTMAETTLEALTDEQKAAATKAGGFRMNAAGTDYERYPEGHPKAGQAIPAIEPEAVTTGVSKTAPGFLEKGFSLTPPEGITTDEAPPPDGMQWAYGPDGNRIPVPLGTKEGVVAAKYDAATIAYKQDAQGNIIIDPETGEPIPATPDITAAQQLDEEGKAKLSREAAATEITALSQKFVAEGMPEAEALTKAEAVFTTGVLSAEATAIKQTGVGSQMSETPEAEVSTREEILGEVANGTEAHIGGAPTFSAATRDQLTGEARTRDATSMIAETFDLPPEIASAIVENPATVEAQMDENSVEVQAAIAALPEEALVSSQMASLVAGIEEGTTPTWARPAVDAVNQMMAERGLSASTVARDSLFNAIIQTALPMAQSNAQALQARAAQNLSNEQQANLEEARLDMTRRMTNVANRQTAASQTAQMAQQIAIQQGTFKQEAVLTSAQQQQQVRVQNLQNLQEGARVIAQNENQTNLANLGNEQQIATMDLQIEAERLRGEMDADQQGKLLVYQTAADFMAKNEGFTQQMNLANLNKDIQVELANLTSKNLYQSELMSNDEKIELANLQAKMQVGVTNANLANAMGIAQLSSDQSIAINNAQTVAGMDMANFSMEQQMELANSKFMQTITMQDFSQRHQGAMQDATAMASIDIATVDQRTKLAVTNAQNFLQMDMANLNNRQQEAVLEAQMQQQALLSDQAATNAALQFNSTSENQTNQFMAGISTQIDLNNAARNDAMEQFNANSKNTAEARRMGTEADINKFNAQLVTQVDEFNATQDFARNQWNATNSAAVEASNVNWRRQANTINTGAQNAVNAQNAQNAFALNSQSLSYLWQELRDTADFDFRTYENEENRKAQIVATALANEGKGVDVYGEYLTSIVRAFALNLSGGYAAYRTGDENGDT